jgi:hypothetical protein
MAPVPIFPLSGVVLFPGVPLPLHVYESRYRTMLRDALAGDRRIGMAVLAPGWERDYLESPAFEPVGCLARVVSAEWRPDDRYDVVLEGERRVRFGRLEREYPYRACRVDALDDAPYDDDDPVAEAGKQALREAATALLPLGAEAWFAPPELESARTLVELAHRVAFAMRVRDAEKLQILAEDRVVERARMVLEHLRRLRRGG